MKIGALWLKNENGKKFFSGTLELPFLGKEHIRIVRNTEKKHANQPDYLVLMDYVTAGKTKAAANGGNNGRH